MSYNYDYSFVNDFKSKLRFHKFHKEIKRNIEKNLIAVTKDNDLVSILFKDSLTPEEESLLDGLVESHNFILPVRKDIYNPTKEYSDSTTYTELGTFTYIGSNSIGLINKIEAFTYLNGLTGTYDIRIYNITNNSVISENQGLINKRLELIDLGNLSNIPKDTATFEIQARTGETGLNNKVFVDKIIVYYNDLEF